MIPGLALDRCGVRKLRELVRGCSHQCQLTLFREHEQQILIAQQHELAVAVPAAFPLALAILEVDA